jgi:hypothetical protein
MYFRSTPGCIGRKTKRPLGRPRRKWEDNIRVDFREMAWEVVDWIRLAQDRDQWWDLVITIMNLQVPFGREFLEQLNEC